MILQKGNRYNARMEVERKCYDKIQDGKFVVIFSFDVDDYDENTNSAIISKINPMQVKNLFTKKKNFYLLSEKDDKVYQTSASIISEENKDSFKIDINTEDSLVDQRKYQRYSFCPEDLGDFLVYQNGDLISQEGHLVELSARGVKLFLQDDINTDDGMIEIFNKENQKFFDIELRGIEKVPDGTLIRGEITNPHINITEFILKSYIDIYKNIIKNMG